MIVLDELRNRPAQVPDTECHDVVQTFRFDAEHKALGASVQVGAARWQPDCFHARCRENAAELLRVERVAVEDDVPVVFEKPSEDIDEVPRRLRHPRITGVVNDAGDLDASGLEVDDEQDVIADEADEGEHLDGEEVGGGDDVGVGLQERAPGRGAFGVRRDALVTQGLGDGRTCDAVVELLELALQPAVAPARVVLRHAHDQLADGLHDAGATDALGHVRPLGCDELAVPAQQGVRCDDGDDPVQQAATDRPALGREASALVVGQAQALVAELLLGDAVLLDEAVDDLGLLATLRWFCRQFEQLHGGVDIELQLHVEEEEVTEQLKIVTYRILQEALNNIAKHSQADSVQVSLSRTGGTLELYIQDNGRGFDYREYAVKEDSIGGLGIESMRERTEISGGFFEIVSEPGQGTTIRARWPSPG